MGVLGRLDRRLRATTASGARPAYWYLRNGARSALNHHRTRPLAKANVTAPIVMSFVRRSGSTWVSQMLAEVAQIVTIGDPLLARNAWLASKLGRFPLDEMYFDASQLTPARPYLDRTLRLQSRHTTLEGWRRLDLSRPVTPFVKIANTPWSMDWFETEFSAWTCILVRHPIDIARSQLKHWNMPPHLDASLNRIEAAGLLPADQLRFAQEVQRDGTEFQKRLVEIVLEYRPLWDADTPIRTISYHRLRDGNLDGFDFLAECDPDWRAAMTRRRDARSKTTQASNTLATAKDHTDTEQTDLTRILHAFGAAAILDRL